jgi:hypothetical protein
VHYAGRRAEGYDGEDFAILSKLTDVVRYPLPSNTTRRRHILLDYQVRLITTRMLCSKSTGALLPSTLPSTNLLETMASIRGPSTQPFRVKANLLKCEIIRLRLSGLSE